MKAEELVYTVKEGLKNVKLMDLEQGVRKDTIVVVLEDWLTVHQDLLLNLRELQGILILILTLILN